jgi:hypothetical protein
MSARSGALLDDRTCEVATAEELDADVRDIFYLDEVGRGDEICGTLNVVYSHESVKDSTLISLLERRGVAITWRKKGQ